MLNKTANPEHKQATLENRTRCREELHNYKCLIAKKLDLMKKEENNVDKVDRILISGLLKDMLEQNTITKEKIQ